MECSRHLDQGLQEGLLRPLALPPDVLPVLVRIEELLSLVAVKACGELSDAVAGRVPRTGPGEIVVFDSTGLALEDLAVCQLLLS